MVSLIYRIYKMYIYIMDCSSDFEVVRMQLLQMNLLKLLVALDCFILLCIWYYAREEKYYPVQNV